MDRKYRVLAYGLCESAIEIGDDGDYPNDPYIDWFFPYYRHHYDNIVDLKQALRKLRDGATLEELDENMIGKVDFEYDYPQVTVLSDNDTVYFRMRGVQMQAVLEVIVTDRTGIVFEVDDYCWTITFPDGRRMVYDDVSMHNGLRFSHSPDEIASALEKMYLAYDERVNAVFGGDKEKAEQCIRMQIKVELDIFLFMSPQEGNVMSRRIAGWTNKMVSIDLGISKTAASDAYLRARRAYAEAMQEVPGLTVYKL